MTTSALSVLPIEDLANVTGGAPVAKPLSQAQQGVKQGGVVKNGILIPGPGSVGGIAVSTIPGVVAF